MKVAVQVVVAVQELDTTQVTVVDPPQNEGAVGVVGVLTVEVLHPPEVENVFNHALNAASTAA